MAQTAAAAGAFVHGMNQHEYNESQSGSSGSESDDGFMAKAFGAGEDHSQYKGQRINQTPSYVRSGFIRKVYSILTIQLCTTFIIALPFNTIIPMEWIVQNSWILQVANFILIGTLCAVTCCCGQAARTFPTNYLFLAVITVCMSVVVGFVTASYSTSAVLLAVAATSVTFFSLTAYACFTKTDFTGMGAYLICALMALWGFAFVMIIMAVFFPPIPSWLQTLYSLCGVLLFSFFIVYDTQKIVGGDKHKEQFDVDDYVFAALALYLDIINMFLFLLQILGGGNRN